MFDENFPDLPLGLGMSLLMNEQARADFESLSEAEKEHVILKCKDAKTKAEMDKIVNSFSSPGKLKDLFQDSGIG